MKYTICPTHISKISIGDTVKCRDGEIRTVGKGNIKKCQLMGVTLFGDCYNAGAILVDKVVLVHAR